MSDMSLMMVLVLGGLLIMFVYNQTKFKNKMLCSFIRPNKQRIEKWVPLHSKYVVFDRGKYGIGHYDVDPDCITLMWYDRGINRLFPSLIPYLEFKWDTPNPLNPNTFQSTWHTPEARHAAWEEHQHIAFAKAASPAIKKGRFPDWFFPLLTLGVCLILMFFLWQMNSKIDYLEQLINIGR